MNAESMQALESGYYQLHRELAEANETIGNLRNDLTKAQARIAELEAPAKHGGPVTDEFDPNLLMVHLNHPCYELDSFYAGSQADADAARGQGYVSLAELRKIQPAAE